MKRVILLFAMLAIGVLQVQACKIELSIQGNKKNCKAGDELVINAKITLTHRRCNVSAKDTKFKYDGIQITGATDWKEIQPGVFERQVKAKVLNDNKKKIFLSATRTCDKEGGYEILTLDKE